MCAVIITRVETKLSCPLKIAASSLPKQCVRSTDHRMHIFRKVSSNPLVSLKSILDKIYFLTKQEWEDCLKAYPAVKYVTGKHTASHSLIAANILNIQRCPSHKKQPGQTTPTAKKSLVAYMCGHHPKKVI